MFSFNCFFDFCVLSHYEKDNFQKLHSRIEALVTKKKFTISKNCLCSNCYSSFNNKMRNIWTLREINPNDNYNAIYVVCTNYISSILSDIFICQYEEKKMNLICQRKKRSSSKYRHFSMLLQLFSFETN